MKIEPMTEQLMVLYGEPGTPNPNAFLAVYNNAFEGVPKNVQLDAADAIARSRKVSSWPTLAECLDALEIAKSTVRAAGAGLKKIENWEQWFGALYAQCENANSQTEIDEAVARVEPYCRAHWCHPTRGDQLREVGAKRMEELRRKNSRNPAGADR